MSFTIIRRLDDLEFLNKELLEKQYIGVDTEFRRTTKDNMKLSLIQVNDSEEIFIIDAIAIGEPEGNYDFLTSNSVIKIFHSCKEDIEAIYAWTGVSISNIFDTQIANALLDGQYSIGYQKLVEEKLGIILDKNETRSNWIRRPLSDSHLSYAASDVEYLINLFVDQEKELTQSSKIDWHKEDLEYLLSSSINDVKGSAEIASTISKAEERELLNKFNEIVLNIAKKEEINPTLFFSKKTQKEFSRLALHRGTQEAYESITNWRKELIKDSFDSLIDSF